MPSTMKKLGLIQFFSWFAFFTMWSLSTPALTEHVYHSPKPDVKEFAKLDKEGEALKDDNDEVIFLNQISENEYRTKDKVYNDSADLVGSATGVYGLSSMAFALLLTFYTLKRKINRKYIHMLSLIAGGLGFISMYFIANPQNLIYSFILIGISWGIGKAAVYKHIPEYFPNEVGVVGGPHAAAAVV
mgnify:CR=1 FL=1